MLPDDVLELVLCTCVGESNWACFRSSCKAFKRASTSRAVFQKMLGGVSRSSRVAAIIAMHNAETAFFRLSAMSTSRLVDDVGTWTFASGDTSYGVCTRNGYNSVGLYEMHNESSCFVQYGDGSYYMGDMRDGKRHGCGVLVDGGRRHEGRWYKDAAVGFRVVYYEGCRTLEFCEPNQQK